MLGRSEGVKTIAGHASSQCNAFERDKEHRLNNDTSNHEKTLSALWSPEH